MTDDIHPKATDIPSLGQVPADITPENLEFLKGLIDSFNTSTSRLRDAYKALQGKVDKLDMQLEESNSELSESLAEQERLSNYLTNILESLSSGVLVIDIDGAISLFNRGAEEMTGVSVGNAVGKPYREIMGDSIPDELTPLWTLSTGKGHTQIEKSVTSLKGKTTPVGSSISALRNSSGDMIGAVEIFMDLTRIKALEEELTRKEKLAALGQMAATMAHKIRNPLGGIAGFAGLLNLELEDNENGRRLVGKITEGVDKLDRIITSLLAYTSKLILDTQMVDLTDLAGDSVKSAATGFDFDGITFKQSDGPVMVKADTEHLRESLLGIIRNAVEAARPDGKVSVAVIGSDDDYIPEHPVAVKALRKCRKSSDIVKAGAAFGIVLVSDEGSGMSDEAKKQLFVPFYTTKENGIGLGLASVLKIVEAHNGEIWIESEKGAGTVVAIILPGGSGA